MNEDIELIHIPCHVCNSKAIAMQDDKPVCHGHFFKLIFNKKVNNEERYKI
tara:strand:- start:636 stop:788 length:153 start_codon:yes stop_codon:yes gene_type:complete